MAHRIQLATPHGAVDALRAGRDGARIGIVVVHEIFGLTSYVADVCGRLDAAGFAALAPAMFDPVARDVDLPTDDGGIARGRALAATLGFDRAVDIVRAGADTLRAGGHAVGVLGFCWGGSVALLGSARLALPAVDYYGARSVPFLDEPLRAPLLCHFGADDPTIPPEDVERHRRAHPLAAVHVYADAGHAFDRAADPRTHHPASAALAWRRTLDFFREHLA